MDLVDLFVESVGGPVNRTDFPLERRDIVIMVTRRAMMKHGCVSKSYRFGIYRNTSCRGAHRVRMSAGATVG